MKTSDKKRRCNKRKHFLTGFAIILMFVLFCPAASGQKAAYKEAKSENTIEAYEKYLNEYPESKYTSKVNASIEELRYNEAVKINTVDAFNSFLNQYPDTRYKSRIDIKLDPLLYEEAREKNTIEAYQAYLTGYPNGKSAYSAKSKLKELRYQEALERNTLKCYQKYLNDFPDDYRNSMILKKMAEIEYPLVRNSGSIAQYKEFTKKYPKSEYSKELEKIIYKDDPSVDFSPEKFMGFRLRNPESTEFSNWVSQYDKYLYKKAQEKSYGNTEEYSLYLTFSPFSPHFENIIYKILANVPYGFADDANFILASEYKKREPSGQHIEKLTPEKIAQNELKYLRKIYISFKVDESIKRAKEYGISDEILHEFTDLKNEIAAFEKLDIQDYQQCEDFIKANSDCPYKEIIKAEIFSQLNQDMDSVNTRDIEMLVKWVPYAEASGFYSTVYSYLLEKTSNEKDSVKKLDFLKPWITCRAYTLRTMEEKIFLADLFSWFGLLQLGQNNMNNAAICNLTASAITHTCFDHVGSKYFAEAFDLSDLDLSNMNSKINEAKIKLQNANNNIKSTRQFLYTLGLASHYFGNSGFWDILTRGLGVDEEAKDELLESTKEKARLEIDKNNEIYQNSIRILSYLFEIDADCWPALRAFIIYPEKEPLERILLMPRFYDYEDNIEEYLEIFKPEAIEIAKQWITNSDETGKVYRGYFVLGYFKQKYSGTSKIIINDDNVFWSYYNIRISNQAEKYREKLVDAAAKESEVALVLYNRIAGDEPPPEPLKKWLLKEIDNKKYSDNETFHIFYTLIGNMQKSEKLEYIDKMYNSYNMKWSDVASQYYVETIPFPLTEEYVKSVLDGSVPYKKLDLIKHIVKNNLKEFNTYVENYLLGNFYSESDKQIIRRNLENMYTKDIVVGYNQQINHYAVNQAVSNSERVYKSLLIQMAAGGLDMLGFDHALEVIKTRFLNDDNLCIAGAEWILQNYDSESVTIKPNFTSVITNSDEQKAVLSFLNAYFSDEPDYDEYTRQSQKLTHSDKWVQLVTLNAKYGNKTEITQANGSIIIKNPVNEWEMSILNENLKQRYLSFINK